MSHMSQIGSSSLLGLPSLPLSIVANTKEKKSCFVEFTLGPGPWVVIGGGGGGGQGGH